MIRLPPLLLLQYIESLINRNLILRNNSQKAITFGRLKRKKCQTNDGCFENSFGVSKALLPRSDSSVSLGHGRLGYGILSVRVRLSTPRSCLRLYLLGFRGKTTSFLEKCRIPPTVNHSRSKLSRLFRWEAKCISYEQ